MIEEERQEIEMAQMRLKQTMIALCTFLEDKYLEQVKEIVMERDPNLHYDIEIDML